MIAGSTAFTGEHRIAAAKCKTCETDCSTRPSGKETPSRKEKLVHFFQSTTSAGSQNAGLRIKLHLTHRRNTDDQSIVVQTKSLKGMSSCFYRHRPILCFCSFEGVLNASLRRATGDDFWLGYDPGVENLPGGHVIRRLRRKKLDAINEPVGRRFRYCRRFFRHNARHIGKNCGRRRKRCSEEGSARVHESLSIHPTLMPSVE